MWGSGIGDAALQCLAEVALGYGGGMSIDLLRGGIEPLFVLGLSEERLVQIAWRWRCTASPATAARASLERHAAGERIDESATDDAENRMHTGQFYVV